MNQDANPAATEQGRSDHNRAWAVILGAGLLVLVLFRWFGWSEWWTVIALSLLMFAYLATAWRNEHVSPDTKGDSVYYLGLLFTFASMVAALLEFTRQAGAEGEAGVAGTMSLVGNLGIALVTTIVGLAGRVGFSVFQASPGDVVADKTQSLAAALDDMKTNVVRGGQSMEDLVGHLQKSAGELEKTTQDIAGAAWRAAETAGKLDEYSAKVAETAAALAQGAGGFSDSLAKLGEAASGFRGQMDEAQQGIAGLGAETETLGGALGVAHRNASALGDAAQRAREGLSGASADAATAMSGAVARAGALQEELARLQQEVSRLGDRTAANADADSAALRETTQRLGAALEAFTGEAHKLGATVGTASGSVSALASAVDDAESRMRASARKNAKGSGDKMQRSLDLDEAAATARSDRLIPATANWFRALSRTFGRGGRRSLAVARRGGARFARLIPGRSRSRRV